jgi:glutamine phosphoribosylpyrophosphate amidotransferase
MCGIVGYWEKSGSGDTPLGNTLLRMITALGCRGPDSTGVAIYQCKRPGSWTARVKLGDSGDLPARAAEIIHIAEGMGAEDFSRVDAYLRFSLDQQEDPKPFLRGIESIAPDVEVVSLGSALEIVKQVGSPANLEKAFCISAFRGSHGIAHTRLSTESVVDLSHSQPFWAHGRPDLAIVHNGHITNYHQLRRRYEQHGVRFYTENDSEIVGIYLAKRLREGGGLEDALRLMLADLDGSYSCLAATESEFGFVRDPFALKPLCFTETDNFVAVATEEIAIRAALDGDYAVRETQAKEVRVWRR